MEGKRREEMGRLMEVRRREQRKVDEQAVSRGVGWSCRWLWGLELTVLQMRLRHSNMIAMAHFLQTKTQPKLVSSLIRVQVLF